MAAAIGGTALSALIKSSGGFELSPQATQYAVQSAAVPANAAATVSNFLGLFSADFFGARLQDVTKDLSRKLARRAPTDRRNINQLTTLHLG